jgi:hypothetical protein
MDGFVTRENLRFVWDSEKAPANVVKQKDRPSTTVSLRLPVDIVEDLTERAPVWGCGSYEALIRLYISEGLRKDEAKMEEPEVRVLLESLERHGIADEVISEVLAEILQKSA